MGQIFFISDTHFGSRYWSKQRHFATPEEMDDYLFTMWSETIHKTDKVYHLGDVANSKDSLKQFKTLAGKKCLIKGNHDHFKLKEYASIFYDIRSLHTVAVPGSEKTVQGLTHEHIIKDEIVFTHIPIAVEQLNRYSYNVHGHVHTQDETSPTDNRYINICVDQMIRQQKSIFVPLEDIFETIKNFKKTIDNVI